MKVRCAVEEAGKCKADVVRAIRAVRMRWKRSWRTQLHDGEYVRKLRGGVKERIRGCAAGGSGSVPQSLKYYELRKTAKYKSCDGATRLWLRQSPLQD